MYWLVGVIILEAVVCLDGVENVEVVGTCVVSWLLILQRHRIRLQS
jgi:hypothetical protein